jgi:hypothetical protein
MSEHGLKNHKGVAYSEYDFAKDGGAVGDIVLRGNVLPAGALITNGWVEVETALAGGATSTVALKVVSAADLMAAMGVGNFAANVQLPVGVAGPIGKTLGPLAAYKTPTLTVAAAALTAGKFTLALEYIIAR